MSARKKVAVPAPAAETAPIDAIETYKGFDADLTCRGFQYAVGQTYATDSEIVRCTSGGFHSVTMPMDAWSYYGPATSRYGTAIASGKIDRGDGGDAKIASAEITIKAEIKIPELVKRAVAWIVASAGERVSTGDGSHAASTGNYSHAASAGYGSHAASTGDGSHAASAGYGSHAASTGDGSHAASAGYGSHAASTGDGSHAASTGYRSHAASTGDGSHAASKGKHSIASSLGIEATAAAAADGWIVLAAWKRCTNRWEIVTVRTAKVGGPEGIKAGVSYRLTGAGEFERVKEDVP